MRNQKKKYKTTRKYPCPYCDQKMYRSDLIDHVMDEHEIMIPEGYSAARAVYDFINKKNYGTCMICGAKVYEWDENICRYKNICNTDKCRTAVSNKAKSNRLEDPEVQKKMLAGRKLSGSYTFSDGTVHTYVGSYERKALEFMDKGLNISGRDILTPGPVIEYTYEGEKHTWILDMLYIPAMLAIDCKDGGSNPNTRPMESYRDKQIAKENAIAEQKVYNYLRLTDNDFGQLLSALADIKYGYIVSDPSKGIYINESSINESIPGGMPPVGITNYYIIPYGMKGMNTNDIEGFTFGNTALDKAIQFDRAGNIISYSLDEMDEFLEGRWYEQVFFSKRSSEDIIKYMEKNHIKKLNEHSMLSALLGFPYTNYNDFLYCEDAFIIKDIRSYNIHEAYARGLMRQIEDESLTEQVIKQVGYVFIHQTDDGFFISTPSDYCLMSDTFFTYDDIPTDLIDLFNTLYEKNSRGEYDGTI